MSLEKNIRFGYMVMAGTWVASNRHRRKITFSLYIYLYLLDIKPYDYTTYAHNKILIIS